MTWLRMFSRVVLILAASLGVAASRLLQPFTRAIGHAGTAFALIASFVTPVMAVEATEMAFEQQVERLESAQAELRSLDKEWFNVVKERGGDGVRSRIGTVYKPPLCEPALCNMPRFVIKFIESNPELDIDLVEEPARELATALNQADFLAYSANFADYGNGGGVYGSSPQSDQYLDKSHVQIGLALEDMNELLKAVKGSK